MCSEKIFEYFTEEKNVRYPAANYLTKKLEKYDDIKKGFLHWLECRDFSGLTQPEINGFTPEKISGIFPTLDAAGVFNFMVTLRDSPESAQKLLDEGLKAK